MKGDILVVDDNPVNLQVLTALLQGQGYKVRPANSGFRALRSAQAALPDLVLLDIMMPEMDGYEVCRQLKADPASENVPVIFLSALDEVFDKVKAFECGCVDYITKPFHAAEIVTRIETQLRLARMMRELAERNAELARLVETVELKSRALEEANRVLESLSLSDGLTGIANRRHFDTRLDADFRRCIRSRQPLSLVMIDIDHFKSFNDFYGHQAGDDCLKRVAEAINTVFRRGGDLVTRYGGEEFAVLLPETAPDKAHIAAERARIAVRELGILHNASPSETLVTISAGVAGAIPDWTESPSSLVKRADAALYAAKKDGRDRVILEGFEEIAK
ncbi:MAG: diguanylate cyclase [Thermoanaerobaculia bacterium]|nr:Chemotaxis response regulator protein-glutamate methylesterase [Thermoanaerobaculia bacterium]MCK6684606.1 diguanylate cyclase [Thermoanaerobaculia bacterium]